MRARIPAFIEEVLRFEPPVHGVFRTATADVEVAGVTVPAGAMVIALIGSASRDETACPDPDRFDPDRASQGPLNLTFCHGGHFCLGAALARLEARLMLEAVLDRFRGVERLPGLTWSSSLIVRGLRSLPPYVSDLAVHNAK